MSMYSQAVLWWKIQSKKRKERGKKDLLSECTLNRSFQNKKERSICFIIYVVCLLYKYLLFLWQQPSLAWKVWPRQGSWKAALQTAISYSRPSRLWGSQATDLATPHEDSKPPGQRRVFQMQYAQRGPCNTALLNYMGTQHPNPS